MTLRGTRFYPFGSVNLRVMAMKGYLSLLRSSELDTKQSDGEALVMLELWGIWSTPSLPSLADSVQLPIQDTISFESKLHCLYDLPNSLWV